MDWGHLTVLVTTSLFAVALPVVVGRKLVAFYNKRRRQLVEQQAFLEKYYTASSEFLKASNAHEQPKLRTAVVAIGHGITNRWLATAVFPRSKSRRNAVRQDAKRPDISLEKELHAMSDDARRAFGLAVTTAIIASTYSLRFRGENIRSGFLMALDSPEGSVAKPMNIVSRVQVAKTHRNDHDDHHHGDMALA